MSLLTVNSSQAEEGNELIVNKSLVNLRDKPSMDSEVIIRFSKGRKLIEIERDGKWIKVNPDRDDIEFAWIHESVVVKADQYQQKKTPKKKKPKRFDVFLERFEEFNVKTEQKEGLSYFSEAQDNGEGDLHVFGTAAWFRLPIEKQHEVLNEVFKIWGDVNPVGTSISIKVFDQNNEQHMVMLR